MNSFCAVTSIKGFCPDHFDLRENKTLIARKRDRELQESESQFAGLVDRFRADNRVIRIVGNRCGGAPAFSLLSVEERERKSLISLLFLSMFCLVADESRKGKRNSGSGC